MLTRAEILTILQQIKKSLDSKSQSGLEAADPSIGTSTPITPTTPIDELEIPDYEDMARKFTSLDKFNS